MEKKLEIQKIFAVWFVTYTKNFGGIMDGGFISTKDKVLANKIKIMRNHGLQKRYSKICWSKIAGFRRSIQML